MLRYAKLMPNDVVDGEGVCVSFWVQGCPIHCPGCHNQQTWDFEGGLDLPSNYLDLIDQDISANGAPECQEFRTILHNSKTCQK